MKLMQKFGMSSNSVVSQGAHPISLQSSMGMPSIQSNQNPMANVMQFATKTPEYKSPLMLGAANTGTGSMYENFASKSSSTATEASFGRTEQVLSNFLHNPMLKEDSELNDVVSEDEISAVFFGSFSDCYCFTLTCYENEALIFPIIYLSSGGFSILLVHFSNLIVFNTIIFKCFH